MMHEKIPTEVGEVSIFSKVKKEELEFDLSLIPIIKNG
jgi:hypothetical protein